MIKFGENPNIKHQSGWMVGYKNLLQCRGCGIWAKNRHIDTLKIPLCPRCGDTGTHQSGIE